MDKQQLAEVLRKHKLWIDGGKGGERANLQKVNLKWANLQGANLQGANLQEANLQEANLQRANLQGADLQGADLQGANLQWANLQEANLQGANLQEANLQKVNLKWANLQEANLQEANLQRANLQWANLQEANLQGADLQGADLQGANLQEADLQGANLPHFQLCPEEGGFIAYKKLCGGVVAKLEIPAEAKRTSSLVGRKCRAEFAKVLGLSSGASKAVSTHDSEFVYRVGEVVHPDKYDDDIRVECTNGIHFFITRKEAEEY